MKNQAQSEVVDLRSDTVTRPTPEMRRAMAEAEVGDDVYGEDPTVNRLEQRAAEIFGREAAIFVPSGTMGNQIAIKIHTKPGQEIICEERAHIFNYEMAMLAHFSGCVARPVPAPDGVLSWDRIARAIAPKIYYRAPTGKSVHEISRKADSVMFCLSKGLGAPVGSLLVGSRAFIDQARVYRKSLGGGMRQAGVLAAAGLIALEKMPARLADDHANAKFLASGLAQVPGIRLDAAKVVTNILVFNVAATGMTSFDICKQLAEQRILASGVDAEHIRMVTHMDVARAGCARALEALQAVCGRGSRAGAAD
jgi:threonine aldolase